MKAIRTGPWLRHQKKKLSKTHDRIFFSTVTVLVVIDLFSLPHCMAPVYASHIIIDENISTIKRVETNP